MRSRPHPGSSESTRADLVLLASYNAATNRKLYAAAARLPKEELDAERGAFFGSLLGTLNHIAAGDSIWLRRFMGHPSAFPALAAIDDIPRAAGLRHRFCDDLDGLWTLRMRLDAIIRAFAAQVAEADMAQALTYRHAQGESSKPFGALLLHFFNHQTHHRGQAGTLLSQAGIDVGVTDLLASIP